MLNQVKSSIYPLDPPEGCNEKVYLEGEEFERILSFNYQKRKHLRHGNFGTREERREAKAQFWMMDLIDVMNDFEDQVKNDQKIIGTALGQRFSKLELLNLQESGLSGSEAERVQSFVLQYFPNINEVFLSAESFSDFNPPLLIPDMELD